MKHFIFFLSCIVTLSVCSCGGGNRNETDTNDTLTLNDTLGVNEFGDSEVNGTDTIDGHVYAFKILMRADKSLETVKNSYGYEYYDNVATLIVSKDGTQICNRSFTKKDFNDIISTQILNKTALTGLVFNDNKKGSNILHFIVTIEDPDPSAPTFSHYIELKVDAQGRISTRETQDVEGESVDV